MSVRVSLGVVVFGSAVVLALYACGSSSRGGGGSGGSGGAAGSSGSAGSKGSGGSGGTAGSGGSAGSAGGASQAIGEPCTPPTGCTANGPKSCRYGDCRQGGSYEVLCGCTGTKSICVGEVSAPCSSGVECCSGTCNGASGCN